MENERGLFEHYKFEVDKGQTLLRVDKFLCDKMNDYSRNKIQEAAERGQLFANGAAIKSNYKVKPGDIITIEFDTPKQEITIIPQDIPLNIVYEDDCLMVINKPAGMVVHPGCGNYSGTLVNAIAWHLRDDMQFEENDPRPGLVHRIDKDTSGLLVVAKNEAAKTALADQFFHKTSERTYIAVVWGRPKEAEGSISGYMGRSPKDRKIRAMVTEESGGKWSLTHYKVLEELGYVSVVECKLETGRTHQIRVHFKSIGHPLFNDETYGGNQILRGTTFSKYKQFVNNCFEICPRQALHAKTLGFTHPVTKEFMQFDSEIPADMFELMEKWREYIAQRED
ncbi:MAG: RluA family pseudouridine synthase [Bacteroidetes bacterium]|nr:RluA family pseudouridine synthase [Bacteroidota bacterium]